MEFKQRKRALIDLGHFLERYLSNQPGNANESQKFQALNELIKRAGQKNPWFTQDFVGNALHAWQKALQQEKIDKWLSDYNFPDEPTHKIGIVAAGNIPLVGLHDLICAFISGQNLLIKQSKKDQILLPVFAQLLLKNDEHQHIEFTEDQLKNFDAVIATGSNNTSRYFEYYFRQYPSVIRHNRNSVAVLSGDESDDELNLLADDIMMYFGLGCRNVAKIYIKSDFDFDRLFKALLKYQNLINHHQYASNYEYNKAVYLMSDVKLLDNGMILFKEDDSFSSPIACLNYEYYTSKEELTYKLNSQKNNIQCVVGHKDYINLADVKFGETQIPALWNYADNINTLNFLQTTIKQENHEEA
ncbi:MAG: acyl-CoA reductase [Psychroflexus sp.]|nr:acyl-CoA reductase [Psychroflexus sp.]